MVHDSWFMIQGPGFMVDGVQGPGCGVCGTRGGSERVFSGLDVLEFMADVDGLWFNVYGVWFMI